MADGSKKSVMAAICGNTLVMISKLIGFVITASPSMLAESIHSFADVMNQALLLLGIHRSEKDPDSLFSRGYGRERFVWALISAVGIFFLGCGVTVVHGIESLMHHSPATEGSEVTSGLGWNVGILLFSLVIEGAVLWIAVSSAKKLSNGPLLTFIKEEADPSLAAVLMEDAAACLGILIALGAIILSHWTGAHYWDAIGSIFIGVLLGFVAIWLTIRNKSILVGQAMPKGYSQKLNLMLRNKAYIQKINHIHTEQIGASDFDVQIEAEIDETILNEMMKLNYEALYQNILDDNQQASPAAFEIVCRKVSVDSMSFLNSIIDDLEEEIRSQLPMIKYIDIEPN